MGLKTGPQNLVVVSSPELIREMFVNRGVIYSGRPVLYVSRELIFPNQDHMFMMQNGEMLRRSRTALKHLTSPAGIRESLLFQETLTSQLVSDLSHGKESPERCIRLWMFRTAMTAIMGPVADEKASEVLDEWTLIQHRLVAAIEATMSSLFEMLPFLKYVPFMPGKKNARQIGIYLRTLYADLYSLLKFYLSQAKDPQAASGVDIRHWGLIGNILRDQERQKEDLEKRESHFTDSQLMTMAQFVQDAATDTTLSTAMTCIMALTANPPLLQRVQNEIDTVCGRGNAPSHIDIDKLPYVKACVLEVGNVYHAG
jgi:cytochrome P450